MRNVYSDIQDFCLLLLTYIFLCNWKLPHFSFQERKWDSKYFIFKAIKTVFIEDRWNGFCLQRHIISAIKILYMHNNIISIHWQKK